MAHLDRVDRHYWTIQPLQVWESILLQGEVRVDEARLPIP